MTLGTDIHCSHCTDGCVRCDPRCQDEYRWIPASTARAVSDNREKGTNVNRTWEDNAREYAELSQGEGWPFAVLVACSVENGGRGNPKVTGVTLADGKVSATRFAEAAETSVPRVLRYLEAWGAAAADDLVPASSSLKPGDVRNVTLPEVPLNKYYPASGAAQRIPPERQLPLREQARADGVGERKVLDIASNPKAMASAIKADPRLADAARDALRAASDGIGISPAARQAIAQAASASASAPKPNEVAELEFRARDAIQRLGRISDAEAGEALERVRDYADSTLTMWSGSSDVIRGAEELLRKENS